MIAPATSSTGFLEKPSCLQPCSEREFSEGGLAKIRAILQPAYLHAEKMRGKRAVLFLGDTGAGKSTAISFLMGAKIVGCTNTIGEKALCIAGEDPKGTFPQIGHALSISETVYTQGFQPNDTDCMFVDCAGFSDTRGENYELIRKIGLEQTCSLAHQICSLVLVIPIWAFLEKGNSVIDLMTQVQAHFPEAFSLSGPERTPSIHVLVTKSDQLLDETAAKLQDGTRLNEHVRELQDQMHALLSRGSSFESFEVQSIQKRMTFWKSLQEIQRKGFLQFIDPKNRKQRRELVAAYVQQGIPTSSLRFEKNITKESLRGIKRPLKQALLPWGEFRARTSQLHALYAKVVSSERKIRVFGEAMLRAEEELNHLNEVFDRVIEISKTKDPRFAQANYAQLEAIWRALHPSLELVDIEANGNILMIKIFRCLQESETPLFRSRFPFDRLSKAHSKLSDRSRRLEAFSKELQSFEATLPRPQDGDYEFLKKVARSILQPEKIKPSPTSFMNLLDAFIKSQ